MNKIGNFESIGCDCEFGLVQRTLNYEPMTLLRWSSINLHSLVRMIDDDFKDLKNIDTYDIDRNDDLEYMVTNTSYHLWSHTDTRHDTSKSELIESSFKRINYLQRQFVKEAKNNKKIYVHKSKSITTEEMQLLYNAMKSLGADRILFVLKDIDLKNTFVESEFGLIAYISDFYPNTKFDEWESILDYALEYFNENNISHNKSV
jgi:hypothetical protein